MNNRKIVRISFVATMILVLVSVASASPAWTGDTAYVGSIYFQIILSPDANVAAAVTHEIDITGIPRITDLPTIQGAGYTIVNMERIGQIFLMSSDRMWPLGTYNGHPTDARYIEAQSFRKALWRLIDKDACVALYSPLLGRADFWLPPGQTKWIEQNPASPDYAPLPTLNRMAAKALLDTYFPQGTTANPNYMGEAWEAQYWRMDPANPGQIVGFEFLATNPAQSPTLYQVALMLQGWFQRAGIQVNLVPTTFNAMVSLLVNEDLHDWQMMYFGGIVWGTTAPDILHDLCRSDALPLWNFAGMNRSDMDAACDAMMTSLDTNVILRATHDIQNILRDTEPYYPFMLWNQYTAFTGPYTGSGGYLGIVNAKGFGAATGYDYNSKLLGRAGRSDDDLMKWVTGNDLDGLNPWIADTAIDWGCVLHVVVDQSLTGGGSYNQKYAGDGYADPTFMNFDPNVGYTPKIKAWVGAGRSTGAFEGNEAYEAAVTYAYDPDTGRDELATYDGIPVADVTVDDLVGDDQLGMRTVWKLRDKLYWHDSDPGVDGVFGTPDDGVTYQITTADVEFNMNNILIGQENERYYGNWQYVVNATALDTLKFEIYEERQYAFAFESHAVVLTGPKHIYEPDLIGPDNIWGTDDDIHHQFWTGWQVELGDDMISARNGMTGWKLSRLIGNGPFIYHISGPGGIGPGWQPGVLTHVEPNVAWQGTSVPVAPAAGGGTPGRVKLGDIDLNHLVELPDLSAVIDAFGSSPGTATWDERADVVYAAQIVNLDDFNAIVAEFGQTWGFYRPSTVPP